MDGAERLLNPRSVSRFGEGNSTGQKRFCWGQDHRARLKACERQPLAAQQILSRRWFVPVQHLGELGMHWGSCAGRAASLLPTPAAPRTALHPCRRPCRRQPHRRAGAEPLPGVSVMLSHKLHL